MADDLERMQQAVSGEFPPEGKLTPDDEGALMMEIAVHKGHVLVRFPKPVAWLALPPDLAVEMAQTLIQRAMQAGYNKPVTMSIG